ncbi:alanine racemase [Pararhizobium capsulatum DSM 1112]|uniref:Alanine racemase n=1 Tax=Pararhizobium capsulatum DSM 1112 TaxID=1121113 RepID=A0ABU0BLI1_9HYPH|nr:alanine racemase [Pararhizobium capsulatum]MDQ0319092.1 alanine racemase [Pararhizobium capsulatum DSM 1112]
MNNVVLAMPREADFTQGASGILTIDLGALQRNYRRLSKAASPAKASAVVKADGYGLGATTVSRALYAEGCRQFFIAHFSEALLLRPDLPADAQIFVLSGLLPGTEIACATNNIIPVLNSIDQLRCWSNTARAMKHTLPAALQFDTGMSRLGVPPEERAAVAAALKNSSYVNIMFLMSHLAAADDPGSDQNISQLAEMTRAANEFPGIDLCFANSGGLFLGADYHGVLVRPGIALYGGQPAAEMKEPMEPVISLDVAVIQTRTVHAGARIGYSGTHIAEKEMRLATLAAGYADGLPRSLSNRGAVYYRGVRLPIVGRVSMDSMTVDMSALPKGTLALGSHVEVIGRNQTLEDVARDAGTISYEILTSLGQRYTRRYR